MPSGDNESVPRQQLITSPDELAAAREHIAAFDVFGLDTEFVGEETYHPQLCLVQVATPERLILIDPQSAGLLDSFWNLVTDPSKQVVVHAGREEVRLCRHSTGRAPENLFDLQIAAGLVGLPYPMGHGALVHQLLGVRLAKAETLTEWRNRPLTNEQLRYAYDDVRFLLPLWQRLTDQLHQLRRLEWAREEFERMKSWASPQEVPTERWRKLRGLGSLDRRKLAVVRALFQWREETAARTNRPARSIARDDLLIEIARRNPAREQDLRVIRGLPRRDLTAIVQVVHEARALPLDACPALGDRDQDPPQLQWVNNVLMAVLGDWCVRKRLASNLVASSSDVKQLVRARALGIALPADALLSQGWRSEEVLPTLQAVLEGKRGIRIADVASSSPFELTDGGMASAPA
jgi:ribonuclease D